MSITILRGNALALPLADESVDLVVTSPPYWSLRAYQDNGEAYEGQIGSESTAAEFIDNLIAVTRELVRVLKPSGSIFVNLGDKMRDKSLMLLPERYRIRAVDELGLIARAVVIWCLSGGAKVYARTPSGDRPIMLRDLVRSYQPENVKLWNGERWTQVLGWNKTPDDDGALELELRTGERIGCTPGHRWPTQRGVIRADELRVGDVIATTTLPEPDERTSPAFLPDGDIGWLVGLYVAEGSRSGTTVQIAGHVNETERHARLARIAKALDGTSHVYQTSEGGATCNLSGSVILGVIDRYVSQGTAHTKRLRKAAWQRGNGFLQAIIEGYLSGDGHHDKANGRWRLGFCANDEWASDLRTLAARLGAKLSLRRAQHVGQFGTFPGWRGEWRWMRSAHHNAKQDGEVVAIRGSRARDFYDLGVEDEPHLFALASGVLTHNSKPNGLPESVTDRVRRSHEDWVHLTKQPRYYSVNLGKLPSSVWVVPTEPLRVPDHLGIDHFAAFPTELPRRIITGWSPREVCTACGEGRRPVISSTRCVDGVPREDLGARKVGGYQTEPSGIGNWRFTTERALTGYACACPDTSAPATPGVVLDPLGGTGTTALVADALSRHGVSVDLSADYCRLAQWRTTDPKQRAKAARVEHVDAPSPDQPDLFEESAS